MIPKHGRRRHVQVQTETETVRVDSLQSQTHRKTFGEMALAHERTRNM